MSAADTYRCNECSNVFENSIICSGCESQDVSIVANESVLVYLPSNEFPNNKNLCPIVLRNMYKDKEAQVVRPVDSDLEGIEISLSKEIHEPGILIIQIGKGCFDLDLIPLTDSIHSAMYQLFTEDCHVPVDKITIRTKVELKALMQECGSSYSHIILIGHSSEDGIEFLDDENLVLGEELGDILCSSENGRSFDLISFCCHSGCDNFASALSMQERINSVIAPNGTMEMRWAVHFLMGFFILFFGEGVRPIKKVVKQSTKSRTKIRGTTPMAIWQAGEKIAEYPKQKV